ncbi:MFS transporter [Streptomyces sp. NBC_00687]|uniref:MFS transporter n=1 Tax=Streptomyces sp. NBC_00687 TaxID=2975807 RepID=UPI00224E56E7|nr:MFS transporter [Streptomyces sp. NBC_00687]MCX4918999.1 MFS transporter [Streptomyces sp. NBC_00687]
MTEQLRQNRPSPGGEQAGRTSGRAIQALRHLVVPPTKTTRPLAVTTLMHTVGTGLVVTLSAIYFTRIVGVSVRELGLGLTVAGLVSLLVGVPFGRLSDRVGPRGLLVCLLLCQGAAVLMHAFVRSFGTFLLVVILLAVSNQGASAVRSALIATAMPPEERVVSRAYLRSVTNAGFAVGTCLASVALASAYRPTYQALLGVGALCFAAAAAAMLRVPTVPPVERAAAVSPWLALRDMPYTAVVVLNALLQLHYAVLEVGIPLWVSEHTDAPRRVVSILFLLNTVIIFLLQVPVGRRWGQLRHAGALSAMAGALVAVACILLGLSGSVTGLVAVAVLVTAGSVHAVGEVCHTTGSWSAGFGLAPEHAQGQYQGLFSTGVAASQVVGAALVTVVVASGTFTGWLIAACVFAVAGFLMPSAVGWAQRGRTAPVQ